ncbi:MAG: NAD(P)H-binding protein [Propionibacteriales bacterium]|nr:NAD(P)H-binding protein [Propionibacteriales bacterium]
MTTITIFGGTGFAGAHLVSEAADRGHRVVAVSRRIPDAAGRIEGVDYQTADVTNADLSALIADSEVVIAALSPRGELDNLLRDVYRRIADTAQRAGRRLVVVGGFSSLRPAPDAPRFIEIGMEPDEHFSAEQVAALMNEATQIHSTLVDLLDRDDDLVWTFFSPGMEFGSHTPGNRTGQYRVSDDGLVLSDDTGRSAVSGADFAIAILDEIEASSPRTGHLAVAY